MKINLFTNAKQEPQILYCRHIAQGVCGYQDETIFIGEDALKEMDKSFAGKPVVVEHQAIDLEKLQEQADGYVVESFYLPEDASHWAKIIIVSDKGHEAVSKGWAVSNAYVPDAFGASGEWHNIPYNREITEGHYTHLAIVSNPRYEEAVIMTPEEFKQYKAGKKEQLNQLQNSKEGVKQQMFKLFTKKEVTNSEDISKAMVELSNGKTVSIQEMINACEEDIKAKEAAKNKKNEDEELLEKVVKVNGEDVAVKDLIKSYEAKKNKCNEDEDEDKDEKKSKKNKCNEDEDKAEKQDKKNKDEDEKENEGVDKRKLIDEVGGFLKDKGLSDEDIRFVIKKMEKESYDKSSSDGKDNEDDKEEKKDKKNSKDFLSILKGAEELANSKGNKSIVADTMDQKLARGAARYGSSK